MRPRYPAHRRVIAFFAIGLALGLSACVASLVGRNAPVASAAEATAGPGMPAAGADSAGPIARGRYLVELLGCADCHTPRFPDGRLDPDYAMAGHKANDPYPSWDDSLYDAGYGMVVSVSHTAFAGPWGVTFARNLTPDRTTGIGGWNEEAFINVLREGTLKPPMPATAYGMLPDEDLAAMFAYFMSLPPVENLVPFRQLTPPRLPGEVPTARNAESKGGS
jgi:mono/diheme cytochrome c family protein